MGAAALRELAALRADASPVTGQDHPEHAFRPAPDRLMRWRAAGASTGLFYDGIGAVRARSAASITSTRGTGTSRWSSR